MPLPIALQLYTVRELLEEDFEGVVRRVAAMGYVGVETAGFPDTTPAAAARLFDELGLQVPSAHMPLPLGDKKNEVVEMAHALGCRRIVSGYLPPEEYSTLDRIGHACDMLNEAAQVAAVHGLSLGVHNHWWEFQPVEGVYPYREWLERLDPSIFFELDMYWIKTAGLDPVQILREFGERAPLLHVKDGPATIEAPMTAVGQGTLDYPAIVAAAEDHAEWLIVELDRCATDMMAAVRDSYQYLTGAGLGRGKSA